MISQLAYVDPDAKLGKDVTVHPFAFIDKNVEIGDNCEIMAAIIIAALLTSVGTATAGIVRIIDKESSLRLLSLLVVISLFFIHCDFNYLTQGTIAYLLTLGAIALYLKEKRFSSRLSIGIALTVLLFWLGGSVALLFGTSILFIEFASCPKKGIITILLPAIALILGTVAVYSGLLGEFRFAFLPDME